MPRPKVKPEDRQRSARACVPCKASKIRCDAAVPCGPCSKRDRITACVYLEPSRKRSRTDDTPTTVDDDVLSPFQRASAPQTPAKDSGRFDVAGGTKRPNGARPTSPGQGVSRLTESRMLLTSKGEKVYVGESASLSFLQFLRQILRNYMGPTGFTENQLKDSMLEVEAMHDESPVHIVQTRQEKFELVQLYREASSGILDLYTVDEINRFLDQHDALSPGVSMHGSNFESKADQAALNIMIAIGCQCRGKKPVDSYNAARSFTCAQKFAFEGFLCDPSIDMVRIFIMMAFYMAQACHRNAVYMYTGIASKAACALGLHRREQYQGLPRPEALARWRTWKSLVILDTIVSAILGRPGSIISLHPDDATTYNAQHPDDVPDPDRTRWLASRAVFAVCSHILELQQSLGNGSNVDIATAENFLRRLHDWNETLPPELRHFGRGPDTTLGPSERELLMGATHVSCLYYFTTILVTRPFLISHLMSTISARHQATTTTTADSPAVRQPSTADQAPQIADLAQASLDAALFLARTGYMAITSSLLSNNMCLLKAWMFAAGLVLGFSKFIDAGEGASEADTAFEQAIHVLARLAESSPQARHYHEILTSLDDAVRLRRAQLAREARKRSRHGGGGRYVSQIFTAELPGLTSDTARRNGGGGGGMSGLGVGASPATMGGSGQGTPSGISPAGDEGMYGALGNLDVLDWSAGIDAWADIPLLSDNLYFDWGSGDGLMRF